MIKKAVSKAAASEGPEAYPLGYVEDLNDASTKLADFFSILLGFCCEMGDKPIADGCGHPVKILFPRKLMIGLRQQIQPFLTSQGVIQSTALMEGDAFILLALDNECGDGDAFSRPIRDLSEAVFVKVIPQ